MAVPPQVTFMTQTARVTLVGSTATNIVTYHFEVVEENGENRRWLCGPSLFGPRTPTVVTEIHVIPARWREVAGVLQKTGMDCRDGRNSKRLTFSICVRSMKCGKVLPGFRYAAFVFLFFSARNFAHRNFVAFEIFARAAADNTRFLT